ncbi:hypothetical protein BEH94_07965 [Candidatus Altiarchaeales archaeon WOR_SM1_SCG]|nr:hypothetical protein BEH94_07965 [Candidatus Altiarchaeales archaeon WOR_SM1_SCG]
MINCIKDGTSYKEYGVSVSVKHGKSETVLFFAIDSNSNNRSNFRDVINTTVICDLLVYYSTDAGNKKICLVELKGKDVEHAADQLIETKEKTENLLKEKRYRNVIWKGLIVHRSSAPRQQKPELKRKLDYAFGRENYRMVHKMKYDLGDFIRN